MSYNQPDTRPYIPGVLAELWCNNKLRMDHPRNTQRMNEIASLHLGI